MRNFTNFTTATLFYHNVTSNHTQTPTYAPAVALANDTNYTAIEIFTVVMLVLLFIVGTSGNGLTMWIFLWKRGHSRKRFELLLSGLALTDFITSIIVPLLFLYGTVTRFRKWDFGYFGCKFISSLFPVTVTFSQGLLILISYDRYKSLSNPFGTPIGRVFVACWIFITLVIACVLVSPYVYALEFVSSPSYGINTCAPSPEKFDQIYLYSVGNISRDFVATISMIILGVLTNKSLKTGGLLGGIDVFKKRRENANKARKMLIVVVCVFSCCVIPLDLFQVAVYTTFKLRIPISKESYDIIIKGNTFLLILQIANCSTNFIIYSKMNRNFTKQIFQCLQKGKHLARSSFRSTFRSSKSEILDSFTNKGALVAILPITPGRDSLFLPSPESSNETKFDFNVNNNNIDMDALNETSTSLLNGESP